MQGAVKKRNADYRGIIRRIALPHQPALVATENPVEEPLPGHVGGHSLPQNLRNSQEHWTPPDRREESLPNPGELPQVALGDPGQPRAPERPDAAALGFRSAALTVWCGDFNYRIDMSRCVAFPAPHSRNFRLFSWRAAAGPRCRCTALDCRDCLQSPAPTISPSAPVPDRSGTPAEAL